MAALWDGEEGDDWTENADRYEATDRWLWQCFERDVRIGASDRVLDVGCGTGQSTRSTGRRASSGHVVGIDLSSRMLDLARRRSAEEGLTNVEFVQGDAQVHPFEPASFDVAISSFGAMFFGDPVAAFTNIGAALRPGGRLAILAWRTFTENEWLTTIFDACAAGRDLPTPPDGSPGPFGLADAARTSEVLGAAGFDAVVPTPLDEPVLLGTDADDAWSFVSSLGIVRGLTGSLDDDTRGKALAALEETVAAHETPEGVTFGSAAWLYTARRA